MPQAAVTGHATKATAPKAAASDEKRTNFDFGGTCVQLDRSYGGGDRSDLKLGLMAAFRTPPIAVISLDLVTKRVPKRISPSGVAYNGLIQGSITFLHPIHSGTLPIRAYRYHRPTRTPGTGPQPSVKAPDVLIQDDDGRRCPLNENPTGEVMHQWVFRILEDTAARIERLRKFEELMNSSTKKDESLAAIQRAAGGKGWLAWMNSAQAVFQHEHGRLVTYLDQLAGQTRLLKDGLHDYVGEMGPPYWILERL